MAIFHDTAKRWRFGLLPILTGTILLAAMGIATVQLLGTSAIYFIPMYVVLYLQHLERYNRLTLWATAALTIVLTVLLWMT